VDGETSPETNDHQAQSTRSAMPPEAVQSIPTDEEAGKASTSERRSKDSSIDIAEANRLSSDAIRLDQPAHGGLEDPRLTQNPWT
jgi:hypothetical protein